MESIQNTAGEGLADSNAFIGGKRALLSYAPARAGLMTASAGYTFAWRGYLGNTQASAVSRFRLERNKVDRLEIEAAFDQKRVAADLGYFFASIVA